MKGPTLLQYDFILTDDICSDCFPMSSCSEIPGFRTSTYKFGGNTIQSITDTEYIVKIDLLNGRTDGQMYRGKSQPGAWGELWVV